MDQFVKVVFFRKPSFKCLRHYVCIHHYAFFDFIEVREQSAVYRNAAERGLFVSVLFGVFNCHKSAREALDCGNFL